MDEKIINQYSDGEGDETPRPERAQASERVSPVRRSKSGVEITFTLSDDEFISLLEQKNLDKVVFDCGMRLPNPNDLLAIKITDIVMDAIKNNSKEYGLIDVRKNS